VLRPQKKLVKRLKLSKQMVTRKVIKYVLKQVIEKKIIIKQRVQNVTEIVMEKRAYRKPVTKIVESVLKYNKTEMREVTRTEPTIVMVNRTWSKPQLKYVLEHVQRRAVRMVIEMKAVEKEVPKTIPVPIGDLDDISDDTDACGCYKVDCGCYGEKNCDCCYPECQCAPSMISPTETEIIITTEECEVPQDYIETITREVPVLTFVNMTI